MDFGSIKFQIDTYLSKLKGALNLEGAFLFGSFAEGKAKVDSDVDIIVLSDDFKEMDDDERLKLLYRKSAGFPYDLHVWGLTPEEYKHISRLTSLYEAKKAAKRIL